LPAAGRLTRVRDGRDSSAHSDFGDHVKHSAGILGTGSYLPKEVVGNEEIARRVGVTAEWIERKTGIHERRHVAPDEATSDLAVRAGAAAMAQARMPIGDISHIIVATSTGDFPQPPTAHLVQGELGAVRAACFDVNVVCSGFVYALALADALVAHQPDTRVLVIGADVYSRILDFTDRRTAVLFGDGAGAVVVGPVPQPYGMAQFELAGRGDTHALIRVEAGGSRNPASHETIDSGGHYFRMEGRAVREFVVEQVPSALDTLLRRAGRTMGEVTHFVPHQANDVLIDELAERCGLTTTRVHRTVAKYGNVGGASIPVALDEANRSGALTDGDLVVLAGFGGGMAIGACLIRWRCC
jgi:3-oxoacyl-(acyl-carrier-protein) synthase III